MQPFRTVMLSLGSLGLLSASPGAYADWAVNMPVGVTPISQAAYQLHMTIFWICVVIGIGVFGVMFYSMYKHRKSKGAVAANFHEHHLIEVIWTVIPFLILIGMAIPATRTLIEMEDTRNAEITLKVTGFQWMWRYEYIEDEVSFFSRLDAESNFARLKGSGINPRTVEYYLLNVDKRVVLPVDTKVRILMTANDVIHAWWVPELGGKKDAIPGFINEMWVLIEEPGVYRGQCAELCGKDHGFMPIVVEAVSKEDYRRWIEDQKAGTASQQVSL